jgi:hypothetical protein
MPRITRIGPKGPSRRADPCHKGPGFASAGRRFGTLKTVKSARNRALSPPFADIGAKISPARWSSGASTLIAACISVIGRGTNSDRFAMTDDSDRGEGQTAAAARNPKLESRQQRLKQALRENLKRRKTQARGRGDPASRPSNADDVLPYDDGNKPGE